MKAEIITAVNELKMPELYVDDMYCAKGSFVNLMFPLPNGHLVKLWEDDKDYFIAQVEQKNSQRCYGVTADEKYLLICEYGCEGSGPEILLLKQWQ